MSIIENELQHPMQRNSALSPAMQTMLALRFFATGSFQQIVGDSIKVSKTTVCRAISRVTEAILSKKDNFLSWPSEEDLRENANAVFNRSRIPAVCGLIDGTHIPIQRPTAHEEAYINRKGFHSINVQVVCLSNYQITDVCCQWPGSSHDAWILRNSALCAKFENGTYPGLREGLLLGDSGYPCNTWLMTPLLDRPAATVSTVFLQ